MDLENTERARRAERIFMKGNTLEIKNKGSEYLNGQVEMCTKDNTKLTKEKA